MPQNGLKWPKMTQSGQNMTKNGPKWPKMAQHGPGMTQNDAKWPKNDARTFPQFFFTKKAVPQTFSLLECMLEGL